MPAHVDTMIPSHACRHKHNHLPTFMCTVSHSMNWFAYLAYWLLPSLTCIHQTAFTSMYIWSCLHTHVFIKLPSQACVYEAAFTRMYVWCCLHMHVCMLLPSHACLWTAACMYLLFMMISLFLSFLAFWLPNVVCIQISSYDMLETISFGRNKALRRWSNSFFQQQLVQQSVKENLLVEPWVTSSKPWMSQLCKQVQRFWKLSMRFPRSWNSLNPSKQVPVVLVIISYSTLEICTLDDKLY